MAKGCAWVDENHAAIDLNKFKDADAWEDAAAFFELDEELDLNGVPYEPGVELLRWDTGADVAQFRCGQHTLADLMIAGSWLRYDVVYDLGGDDILRVLIRHYSYFEE